MIEFLGQCFQEEASWRLLSVCSQAAWAESASSTSGTTNIYYLKSSASFKQLGKDIASLGCKGEPSWLGLFCAHSCFYSFRSSLAKIIGSQPFWNLLPLLASVRFLHWWLFLIATFLCIFWSAEFDRCFYQDWISFHSQGPGMTRGEGNVHFYSDLVV